MFHSIVPPWRWWVSGLITLVLCGILVQCGAQRPAVPPTPTPLPILPVISTTLPRTRNMLGVATAPVTMTLYTEVDCPACQHFALDIVVPLMTERVQPGTLQIELHPVALTGPQSESAIQALLCANDQNAVWPYYETLIKTQGTQALTEKTFSTAAQLRGMYTDQFVLCHGRGVHHDAAHQLTSIAQRKGVTRTPMVAINGTLLTPADYLENGQPSLARLRAIIDAAAQR